MAGSETKDLAVSLENERVCGIAQTCRRLDKGIKHHLQVERRSADNLEHVGGCRLLLQRFAQIIRALPQLIEKPCVLDGDDGLGGEIL